MRTGGINYEAYGNSYNAGLTLTVALTASAPAAPELTVTQSLLTARDGDDSAYLFAKVENTGDVGVGVDTGRLVVMNEASEIICTEDYIYTTPSDIFLEPGEFVYVGDFIWETELEYDSVYSHELTFGTDNYYTEYESLSCEATYEFSGAGTYENYIYVTVTNPTEALLSDVYVTVGMYDTAGNLIFANGMSVGAVSIYPGSSVMIDVYVDDDIMAYYKMHEIQPSGLEAIAYYSK